MCIEGPTTHCPLHALSQRQDSTATPTPEDETVPASTVARTIIILAIGRRGTLLTYQVSKGCAREKMTPLYVLRQLVYIKL